jgi:hypothetical protein
MRKLHLAGLFFLILILAPVAGECAELVSGEIHEQLEQAMERLNEHAEWRAPIERPARERNRTEFVVVGSVSEVVVLTSGVAILVITNPVAGSRTTYPYTLLCPTSSPALLRCLGAREGARYRASGFLFPEMEDGQPVEPYLYNALAVVGFASVR